MDEKKLPEFWLRNLSLSMPGALIPVAAALLQAELEIVELMEGFSPDNLWIQPRGLASVGFHLRHITGVMDRLCTYARGEALSSAQLNYLSAESSPQPGPREITELIQSFKRQLFRTIGQMETVHETAFLDSRNVGRLALPATVIGLYIHIAEHCSRHLGQLIVTVRMIESPTP